MVKEHGLVFFKANAVYKQTLITAIIIFNFSVEYIKNTVYKAWVDFLKSRSEIA